MHSFAPVPTVIPGWRGFLPTRVELLWGWSAHLPIAAAATVSPAVVVALLRKIIKTLYTILPVTGQWEPDTGRLLTMKYWNNPIFRS